MNKITSILLIILVASHMITFAQYNPNKKDVERKSRFNGFNDLIFTDIPGAPKLTVPVLITGTAQPIISQGHGLAAPAFFDWNGDGLKDLLIGEFGSGVEYGYYMGNFIRVYQNIGTETNPKFTDLFDYARPPFKFPGNGTPFSVNQLCCIGFTPQFIDLNSDGYADLITGQYQGEVTWFQGSKEGFLQGEPLSQDGNPRDPIIKNFIKNQNYWLYSSASFGDLTNDGLPDLIVGGASLRISKNIGTAVAPHFSKRELLLDIHGQPLMVYEYTSDELNQKLKIEKSSGGIITVPVSGDHHLSPYVVDWDNDGVLDLLVTNSYEHEGLDVIHFFRGMKVHGEHRFQIGIPLFKAKNKGKAFPGSGPRISVTDWNNDGIKDLLIGTSVVMVRGEFNNSLSWNWEKDMGLQGVGKDPAVMGNLPESTLQNYKQRIRLPAGISMNDYMTIRHQGFVYIMLGRNEKSTQGKN